MTKDVARDFLETKPQMDADMMEFVVSQSANGIAEGMCPAP